LQELEGYSEEPFAGNLQEPQAADEHAQEDVVEVEQHAEVDAPRFDLLGNIVSNLPSDNLVLT
jgi:hypothetical protein